MYAAVSVLRKHMWVEALACLKEWQSLHVDGLPSCREITLS